MRTQRRKGPGGYKSRSLEGRAQRPHKPGGSDAERREPGQLTGLLWGVWERLGRKYAEFGERRETEN